MSVQDCARRLEELVGLPPGTLEVQTGEEARTGSILVPDGHAAKLIKRIEKNDRDAEIVAAVRELFGVKA
jgi:hypothetical protein